MSAGVAERPLVGCDLSITGCMGSSGDGFGLVLLAQTVTSELQSVSIVDDAVEDGVGQGRLAEHDITPQYRNDCHPWVLDATHPLYGQQLEVSASKASRRIGWVRVVLRDGRDRWIPQKTTDLEEAACGVEPN